MGPASGLDAKFREWAKVQGTEVKTVDGYPPSRWPSS